jgi:hypothetical protein
MWSGHETNHERPYEWLTHVLLAYAAFTVLTWVVSWLDQRWVAVAMVGSIIPDLGRIELLVEADWIEATFGVPFSWGGMHTLAGIGLLCVAGATLVRGRRRQIRTGLLLAGGALLHVVVDLPQVYADDRMLTNLYRESRQSDSGLDPEGECRRNMPQI